MKTIQPKNITAKARSSLRNTIGKKKKGDLSGVFVYKFDCVNQQFLMAYQWEENKRVLLAVGPHENSHRDLKR